MTQKLKVIAVALAALVLMPGAIAQNMDTIVVTASRIDTDDLASTPNITLRVPADFILTQLSYESGTRDAGERRTEMKAMYDKVVKAAGDTPGISIEAGSIGYSAPIETATFEEMYRSGYGAQKSTFDLVLRIDVVSGDDFDALRERAEAFVDTIGLVGRTEEVFGDEQYLGVTNASRHRATLLQAIRNETVSLNGLFKADQVIVTGLENKVITQPSAVLELELFIPYTLSIETRR